MSAHLTSGGKKTEINRSLVYHADEHAKIDLAGLKPGSTVQTRIAGAGDWSCETRADGRGKCEDFLMETCLHSLLGEYEVRCQSAEAELYFFIKLSSELTEEQIDRMISELANPELRLKVEERISTRVPELREDVKVFGELWGVWLAQCSTSNEFPAKLWSRFKACYLRAKRNASTTPTS